MLTRCVRLLPCQDLMTAYGPDHRQTHPHRHRLKRAGIHLPGGDAALLPGRLPAGGVGPVRRQPQVSPPPCQVNPLPDLRPGGFDLILDGQFMTAGLARFLPGAEWTSLITGPAARFLNGSGLPAPGVAPEAGNQLRHHQQRHRRHRHHQRRPRHRRLQPRRREDVRLHPARSPGPGLEPSSFRRLIRPNTGITCAAMWPPGRPG